MEKFTKLTAVAAPLPIVNCDTDKIIPARFLKTLTRTGLGKNLFDPLRYDPKTGEENPDFVLNKPAYRNAEILVAGHNFGCGSSREHAPWALLDFGIRCVIAPSFADIFHNNCFKNGILPITLSSDVIDQLFVEVEKQPGYSLTVDLQTGLISGAGGGDIAFSIDAFQHHRLLHGLDDIGLTLENQDAIRRFEKRHQDRSPWLFNV